MAIGGSAPPRDLVTAYLCSTNLFCKKYSCFALSIILLTRVAQLPQMPPRSLQWRRNGPDGVSNHQPHHWLLKRLFRRRSKNTIKLRVTGLCTGIHQSPVNSPHTWPVTRKMFSFDAVIMIHPICYLWSYDISSHDITLLTWNTTAPYEKRQSIHYFSWTEKRHAIKYFHLPYAHKVFVLSNATMVWMGIAIYGSVLI